jgi:hypothetical protein
VTACGVASVRRKFARLQASAWSCSRTALAPELIERWSLTSLCERLIKTSARLVRHARYAVFQFAEAALPRKVFAGVLGLINGLRGPPAEAASA